MFTGIIEETGEIAGISRKAKTASIEIRAKTALEDAKPGDSIAVNGVCLTVTTLKKNAFVADLSEETLKVTAASNFKRGLKVNLERALQLSDRLSGHLVMGHVDCAGRILERKDTSDFSVFQISFNPDYAKYIINKGSIAVDGVSLTVNEVAGGRFRINIIPHTLNMTNLRYLRKGDTVNLEFDIIGKYVEKILSAGRPAGKKESVSKEALLKAGFFGGNIL